MTFHIHNMGTKTAYLLAPILENFEIGEEEIEIDKKGGKLSTKIKLN